jgi:hypothetical protein
MSEEFRVNLELPEGLNLTTEELNALRADFKAELIDILEAKGMPGVIITDDVTIVESPEQSQ